MATEFYVNPDGSQIGGFGDGAVPSPDQYPNAIKVNGKPKFGDDIWDFQTSKFKEDPLKKEEREKKDKKAKAKGSMEAALARLILGQPMTTEDIKAAEDFLS